MHRTIELINTIYEIKQLVDYDVPQIALAGRSNVGKSSLINCLAGRKKLAKISGQPGKTRSLNYYEVHPDAYYLVDLPGYGYARASKADRAKWAKLIEKYLENSPQLRAVAVLLDSRHNPQQIDLEMTNYVRALGLPIIPVLTKCDKPKQREREKVKNQWDNLLQQDIKPLFFSAKTGMNKDKLWDVFAKVALGE